ncbi:MAG: hypothetical protein WBL71_02445 [Bacillota bacterium]
MLLLKFTRYSLLFKDRIYVSWYLGISLMIITATGIWMTLRWWIVITVVFIIDTRVIIFGAIIITITITTLALTTLVDR